MEVRRSAPEGERGANFRGGRGRGRGGGGGNNFSHDNQYNNQSAGMGNMGNMGSAMPGFDPSAMAEYFKQMGWGQWNPMMMMRMLILYTMLTKFSSVPQAMMMGGGMGMPGMPGMAQMPGMSGMPGMTGMPAMDQSGAQGFQQPTSGPFSGAGRGRGNAFGQTGANAPVSRMQKFEIFFN